MARSNSVQGKKGRQGGGIASLLRRLFSKSDKTGQPSAEERLERARRRRAAAGVEETEKEPEAPSISQRAQKHSEIAQSLWGENLSSPYNSGLTDAFLQPIEFEKDQEFLEIGAGLGGCADKLSEKLGIRITALESNGGYLEYLEAQATMKPKGHPVTYGPFVPVVTEFRPRAYHAALIKDALYQIADKEGFLKKIKESLRTSAHLAICDFVLRDKGIQNAATDAWTER